ncbi:hypothetical protein BDP27DRAFT_1324517 [Rhodocollybia butyracea]|uniref:Uncharacterized protein n=1 Tax=Rhodocollybia butyracea TaxID=206335 RepID=A0A9P5U8J6_9AGAR|nr:hypothetical protein BDP27DRAFT_1324517 [Rhodocollybia butyracea]
MFPNIPDPEGFVTHPSLHIRDAHDAHVVLEAVRLGILPLIRRRLVASERESLSTGHVYVWEEAEDEGGYCSRMRGDYLFYEEKVDTTAEEKEAKAVRRLRRASDPTARIVPPPRKDRPSKPDGLTKQTYSALVHLPGTNDTRKWHVVAYFSGTDYTRLPIIESYDYLSRLIVPKGIFFNSKSLTSRPDPSDSLEDTDTHRNEQRRFIEGYPLRPLLPAGYNPGFPPQPHSPAAYVPPMSNFPPRSPIPGDRRQRVLLPPLSALASYPNRPVLSRHNSGYSAQEIYSPLSTEDRRALDRLRINL